MFHHLIPHDNLVVEETFFSLVVLQRHGSYHVVLFVDGF